jgi:alkaline phosphatase D
VHEHAKANGVTNLTSIVGDVHVFFAGDLHTDGRVTGAPVGTEFVGASVSHSALTLPGLDEEASALVTERLPIANPHLKFANFRNHGYCVLEADEAGMRVDYHAVDTVLEPTSRRFTLASFEVESGVPEVRLIAGAASNQTTAA